MVNWYKIKLELREWNHYCTLTPTSSFLVFWLFFVCFENQFKKISWKWYVVGLSATIILALLFPLVGLKRYLIWILTFSQMLIWAVTYVLMAKKINKTVAFFWALSLASLVGVIYNIWSIKKEELLNSSFCLSMTFWHLRPLAE